MDKNKSAGRRIKLIAIVGPTASGKTALSLKLAKKFRGEIISADSRAIYRGMDVGTAKPLSNQNAKIKNQNDNLKLKNKSNKETYLVQEIPHHLIDIAEPNKTLTLADYKKRAVRAISNIAERNRIPFLVGGTALYIYAVADNWLIPEVPPNRLLRRKLEKQTVEILYRRLIKKDPAAAKFVDPNNKRRIIRALEVISATGQPFSRQRKIGPKLFDVLFLGIRRSKEKTKRIIRQRTKQMLKDGLINEVKKLLKAGHSPSLPALSGIHYKEIIDYLNKKITLPQAVELINKNDERLVRRQMAWFKRDKRICWTKTSRQAEKIIKKFLNPLQP